jgi:hypothetical protein
VPTVCVSLSACCCYCVYVCVGVCACVCARRFGLGWASVGLCTVPERCVECRSRPVLGAILFVCACVLVWVVRTDGSLCVCVCVWSPVPFSPDAFCQHALQLAFYRLHGRFAVTYETAATRRSAPPAAPSYLHAHGRPYTDSLCLCVCVRLRLSVCAIFGVCRWLRQVSARPHRGDSCSYGRAACVCAHHDRCRSLGAFFPRTHTHTHTHTNTHTNTQARAPPSHGGAASPSA